MTGAQTGSHITRPDIAALFLLFAGVSYLASRLVVTSGAFLARPDLLALAVAIDLAFVLPAAYYVICVRHAGFPPFSVLPVAAISVLLATAAVPGQHPLQTVTGLTVLLAETVLVAVLAAKAGVVARSLRDTWPKATFDEVFPCAAREVIGSSRVSQLFISEIVLIYFALFSYRRRPALDSGVAAFTSYRRGAWPAAFGAIVLVIAVEALVVHLLVSQASEPIAWLLTGFGLYGLLWMVGDFRALVSRPSLLTDSELQLRIGVRCLAVIPLGDIHEVRRVQPHDFEATLQKLVVIGEPNWLVILSKPIEMCGILGSRKIAARLAVAIDQAAFADEVATRLSALRSASGEHLMASR